MNDDLDEDVVGVDGGFDEFSQSSGLGDGMRRSPMMKVGAVVLAIGVVVGALYLFGGDAEPDLVSNVAPANEVVSTPGEDAEVDPVYTEAVELQNQVDLERAQLEGGSTIPVPIGSPETRLEVPEVAEEADDPLHRWRALQEERISRQMQDAAIDVEPVTVLDAEQQNEAINALAQAMGEQMRSILAENSSERTFTTRTLISYDGAGNGAGGVAGVGGANGADGGGDQGSDFDIEEEPEIIVPAGKIVYGQTLLEIDSDIPSVVLVQMVSGPLKGWKLLGSFQLLDDIGLMTINFDRAVNDNGDTYDVDAILLDPETTLAATRTYINRRYLRRVVYPAAAAFIESFAEAVAETDDDVVVVEGGTAIQDSEPPDTEEATAEGIRAAAQRVTEIIDDQAEIPIKVKIAAGTPIGIFFTQNVEEEDPDDDI